MGSFLPWAYFDVKAYYDLIIAKKGLFGLCYAMDGGYKGWNPYIERHLAIFVNCSWLVNKFYQSIHNKYWQRIKD